MVPKNLYEQGMVVAMTWFMWFLYFICHNVSLIEDHCMQNAPYESLHYDVQIFLLLAQV